MFWFFCLFVVVLFLPKSGTEKNVIVLELECIHVHICLLDTSEVKYTSDSPGHDKMPVYRE